MRPTILFMMCFLLFSVFLPSKLFANDSTIIAVFDIEDKGWGVSKSVLSNLTDYLTTLLIRGGYQVIPRTQIRQRIIESKVESHKECFDMSCQIDLGRELSAQKSLSTQIFKIEDICQITSTLYDLRKAIAEQAAFAQTKCDKRALLKSIEKVAEELCLNLANAQKSKLQPDPIVMAQQEAKRIEEAKLAEEARLVKAAKQAEEIWRLEESKKIEGAKRAEEIRKAHEAELAKERKQKEKADKMVNQEALNKIKSATDIGTASNETKIVDLEPKLYDLEVNGVSDTPMNPYKRWGHIFFWSGAVMAGFGALSALQAHSAADDYAAAGSQNAASRNSTWKGLMIAGFLAAGVGVVTGIVLWNKTPKEETTLPAAIPTLDGKGMSLVLGGRW